MNIDRITNWIMIFIMMPLSLILTFGMIVYNGIMKNNVVFLTGVVNMWGMIIVGLIQKGKTKEEGKNEN